MKKDLIRKKESQDVEINIVPLLKEILKKIWLVLLVGLVLGGLVFGAAKLFVKPTYRCGFTAYVNNKQTQQASDYLTVSDVNASKQLVQTYSQIIKSNTILTKSAKLIGINENYESLRTRVTTEIQDETEIISVYVVSSDPSFAYKFSDAIAKTAPDEMAKIVEGSSMKIIDYPVYSDKRYKPSYIRYGIIGFIVGALLVMIYIVIRYFMDDTIKSETDMEARFSLPILGVIPDVAHATEKSSDYYSYNYYSSGHDKSQNKESEKKSEKQDEKEA